MRREERGEDKRRQVLAVLQVYRFIRGEKRLYEKSLEKTSWQWCRCKGVYKIMQVGNGGGVYERRRDYKRREELGEE